MNASFRKFTCSTSCIWQNDGFSEAHGGDQLLHLIPLATSVDVGLKNSFVSPMIY